MRSDSRRKALAALALAAALASAGCEARETFRLPEDPMVGKPAPGFSFHSVHKRTFPSSNFLGKTLVLAFVRPGQPEAPTLLRELEAMRQEPDFAAVEFVVLAPEDDPLTEPYWLGLKNNLPIALDFSGAAGRFGAGSLPMVVVTDYKGVLRLRLDGYLGAQFWPRLRATRELLQQVEEQRTAPTIAP